MRKRIKAALLKSMGMLALAIPWTWTWTWARASDVDRVVVVRNESSAISRAVAEDYSRRRGVSNIVSVRCPDAAVDVLDETIDVNEYEKDIESPIRSYLLVHPRVDFIVLTKGIPIRLRGAGEGNGVEFFSVDSRLAALDYVKVSKAIRGDIADPDYRAGYI